MPDNHSKLTFSLLKESLPRLLEIFPSEWKGTTFKNSILLGREKFATRLQDLLLEKGPNSFSTEDLIGLGNAEDYLRVSTNLSTIYEVALASKHGLDISQVFTFSSMVMPIMGVLLTTALPVHYYVGKNGASPFTDDQLKLLLLLGGELHVHAENVPGSVTTDSVTLASTFDNLTGVDGVIHPNALYIVNTTKITPASVLVIRKRMTTPLTTPVVLARLQDIAGVPITADTEEASADDISALHRHLNAMSGADNTHNPIVYTTGLAVLTSLWYTLVTVGGCDVVMASTSYGGSSEVTDIISRRTVASKFRKHTYDITGKNDITAAIRSTLSRLSAVKGELLPTTVLFIELPTNPDMKVPVVEDVVKLVQEYKAAAGTNVLLVIDTTFAPSSGVLAQVKALDPEIHSLVFISLSKSVSRGITTAGALVSGHTNVAHELFEKIRTMSHMLDTSARRDQILALARNHTGVEERCQKAYEVACQVGAALQKSVEKYCESFHMDLAFVKPEEASKGFTSSTFSFNLPGLKSGDNAALAQRFVDYLTVHEEVFKPCVSFGQDNGLVYATVPATSTQGAIKAEDKAKQAVGGVQLVRLSFPPTCNVDRISSIVDEAVQKCYE